MSHGQAAAVEELFAVASASGGRIVVGKQMPLASGSCFVPLELDCSDYERRDGGLPLALIERFLILIDAGHPFHPPSLYIQHDRFDGFSHVQWTLEPGSKLRHVCLYRSVSVDWNAADGMLGFLDQLDGFLRSAALGEEDLADAPVHPPVAYLNRDGFDSIVAEADCPIVRQKPWIGQARLVRLNERTLVMDDVRASVAAAPGKLVAPVYLLPKRAPFEFPKKLPQIVEFLEAAGVSEAEFKATVKKAAAANEHDSPMYIVIGTPLASGAGQEPAQSLLVWKIEPTCANGFRATALVPKVKDDAFREAARKFEGLAWAIQGYGVEWCHVMEARPQVVTRRDATTPAEYIRGKHVAVFGSGALGAAIALQVARMGPRKMSLFDKASVSPGVLARQPFSKKDVGRSKARCVAEAIESMGLGVEVDSFGENVLSVLDDDTRAGGIDLVIDATASLAILQKTELVRKGSKWRDPEFFSVGVGPECRTVIVRACGTRTVEGPWAVDRRAKLSCAGESQFYFNEFWPDTGASLLNPEPGCSDPTFVGSAADTAAMSGLALNLGLDLLSGFDGSTRTGFALASSPFVGEPLVRRHIPKPTLIADKNLGHQIVLSPEVLEAIDREKASMATTRPGVETGGIMFGEWSGLLERYYVDVVTGPPSDSVCSEMEFECGVEGVAESNEEMVRWSRGSRKFQGIWHSHPCGSSAQSPTDTATMKMSVLDGLPPSKQVLMLICGRRRDDLSSYVYSRKDIGNVLCQEN